jgi:hypothetical protein
MLFIVALVAFDDKIHTGENRVTFVGIFFQALSAELSKVIGAEN